MSDNSEDVLDVIAAVNEGDIEVVKEAIESKLVSVNCADKDGCTLLHWAAINNRVEIANFLIESGLNRSGGGGVLYESPLQWAIRKKFYGMADLIVQKCHCDLAHRSKTGSDALDLACKLGDINAVYLLLNWGANPNTIDGSGDTPLMWLLKNRTGQSTLEIIRMLLKFGADVRYQNTNDGNNVFHVMAANTKIDLSLAFLVYQAGGAAASSAENKAGLTAYTLAVKMDNRRMARFLFDQLIYNFCPFWTPTIIMAVLCFLLFLFIGYHGLIYGLLYWAILYTATAWSLLQWQIVDLRGRVDVGTYAGTFISLAITYQMFVFDFMSIVMKFLMLVSVTALTYAVYSFHTKKPQLSKTENRSRLASLIIESAPSEGPDEEAALTTALALSPKKSFVKDAFTGQLQRVSVQELDQQEGRKPAKGRTLSPRICGYCLSDKRSFSVLETSKKTANAAALNNSTSGTGAVDTTISLASHCNWCNCCVIDQDHHCQFLANCVGRGNRRMFVAVLVASALCCFLFFIGAKWTHYGVYCPEYKGGWFSQLISVEWCMWTTRPAFTIITLMAGYGVFHFLFFTNIQINMVARETTTNNAIRNRYEKNLPANKRMIKNMWNFVKYGTYQVTYPKKGVVPPKPCCKSHAHVPHSHDNGGYQATEESPESQEYKTAMKMLDNIDAKLGNTSKNRPSSSVAAFAAAPVTPERPSQGSANVRTQEPVGSKNASNADEAEGDDDDDYDEEFIASAHNHYVDYYFNNSDGDSEDGGVGARAAGDAEGGNGSAELERDLEKGGGSSVLSNNHYDDQADEHTALISHGHNRFRADSIQLAKEPPKKGAVVNRMERL